VCIQGFKQHALAVSTDPEHRFELALQLGELKIAYQLAVEAEVCCSPSDGQAQLLTTLIAFIVVEKSFSVKVMFKILHVYNIIKISE